MQFPFINSIIDKVLEIFQLTSQNILSKCPSDRHLNSKFIISINFFYNFFFFRDLFRLCRRFNNFFDFSDNLAMFNEIYDLFLMHLSNKQVRFEISVQIAEKFSLSKDLLYSLFNVYKPEIFAEESVIKIGRATLNRNKNSLM